MGKFMKALLGKKSQQEKVETVPVKEVKKEVAPTEANMTVKANNKSSVRFEENAMKTGTFRFQESLPQLPIPELKDTMDRFLETVEPLLTEEELQETKDAVQDLLDGKGPAMQKALVQYGKTQDNYVDAFWDDAYLLMDDPIVVNVNPYFVLEDDPTPARNDQIIRATNMVMSALKWVHSIRQETMKVDMVRKTPLCMSQYPKVMGSARIPHGRGPGSDKIVTTHDSTHIVVICRNQMYYFDVVTPEGAMIISADEVAENLAAIRQDASSVSAKDAMDMAVGAFTTETRTTWAKYRTILTNLSENNAKSLQVIDKALFVLCLDMCAPANLTEASTNALRGYSSEDATGIQTGTCLSRWYDKLMFIVCENGSASVNFEHAPADGHSVLRMVSDVFTDTIIKFAQAISGKADVASHMKSVRHVTDSAEAEMANASKYCTDPRKLEFDLNEEIRVGIHEAYQHLRDNWIDKYDIQSLEYEKYGKKFIVGNKISPDAFVQMSMMAAIHRVTKELPCTYESVMTKAFVKGRTEAGRSVTKQAKKYIEMIHQDDEASDADRVQALVDATRAHSAMTSRCAKGLGVDRHLYALKCCHNLKNDPSSLPKFFSCVGYRKLSVTILSTSNCGNPALKLFGFGPVSEHGIGIGYIIKDGGLSYTFCSKSINVPDVMHALVEYLENTHTLLSRVNQKQSSLAKVRKSLRPGKFLK